MIPSGADDAGAVPLLLLLLMLSGCRITGAQHCHPCNNRTLARRLCQVNGGRKTVDECGLCGRYCDEIRCDHQLKVASNQTACFFGAPSELSRVSASASCASEAASGGQSGVDPVTSCSPPSSADSACQCPVSVDNGDAQLTDSVVISAYPWSCDCHFPAVNVTALDIRLRYSEWQRFSLSVRNARGAVLLCRHFLLPHAPPAAVPPSTAVRPPAAVWLQYDCPFVDKLSEGATLSVEACATGASAQRLVFRVPHYQHTAASTVHQWRPLIVHHAHRRDRLVFSVQRGPGALCRRQYRVRLARCRPLSACSRPGAPPEHASAAVTLQVNCTDDSPLSERVSVEFQLPAESGHYALLLYWTNDTHILSTTVKYDIVHSVMPTVAGFGLLFLCLGAVSMVVLRKKFTPSTKTDDNDQSTETLVLYNSELPLVRHLANFLQTNCHINVRLDIAEIPNSSQEPLQWLLSAIDSCHSVVLLWLPAAHSPPVYRLFHTALHQLPALAAQKQIVVACCPHSDPVPRQLVPFRRLQLPQQLPQLAKRLRAGPVCSGMARIKARKRLSQHVFKSPAAVSLCQQLQLPTQPIANQPPLTTQLPDTAAADWPVQPVTAPLRWPQLLLKTAPSVQQLSEPHSEAVHNGAVTGGRRGDLSDIVWH